MARGALDTYDLATFGQLGPASSIVLSLFGYYIGSGGNKRLVYYGRGAADATGDSTLMSPKTPVVSEYMSMEFGLLIDPAAAGKSTTLRVGLRGDLTNGYALEMISYGTPSNTVVNLVKYTGGVKSVQVQEIDAWPTFTELVIGMVIKDTPSGVDMSVFIDGTLTLSFVDSGPSQISSSGNMWLEFDSTSSLEATKDGLIFISYFDVTYAPTTRRDPMAMLRWSDDGGNTWSKERWESFGGLGEYRTRVKWNALGASRDRVYWFQISDPVKVILINSLLRVSGEDVPQ